MKRLIERGLKYGNLVHVTSSALVERYNRALEHLTGKRTVLSDFHVDISGYSPEIGAEFDDRMYLNHAGVNRQFILLTLDQKRAPLLEAQFSTSRSVLRAFIEKNESELFALTAQDAVAGELVNSVFDLSDPARLFDIRQIRIEADTTRNTVANAAQLGQMIDTFKSEPDAWYDDVLIADMIDLAKETGDVIRNPVRLTQMEFDQGNFWSAHFGGTYVFRDVDHPAVITAGDLDRDVVPMKNVFRTRDRKAIAKFLQLNALVQPIVEARGLDAGAILQQKMDFILINHAAEAGVAVAEPDRRQLRSLARQFSSDLPEAYHGLAALRRWAVEGGAWPHIDADHEAYFYVHRAADVPDADLVNRLLSELAPLDARQLFICHKELFYQRYASWPEGKKEFVSRFLEREYLADKAGARAALFGFDAPMDDDQPTKRPFVQNGPWSSAGRSKVSEPIAAPGEDLIARVGPWGALGRR